jgi:hypothetical protein
MAKQRVFREPVVQPQDQSIKLIRLTKGQVAIVDACEYERAMQLTWCAAYRKSIDGYYAVAWTTLPDGTKKQIFMHHFIAGNDSEHVHHWDDNGLNNVRSNLRPCTHRQNFQDRDKPSHNTSGYKGVSWDKSHRKWAAYIKVNGHKKHLGLFVILEDAARAYNAAALLYFGEFARLNHIP